MRNTCYLFPAKESRNEDNKYGHNFNGTYCRCKRAYDGSGMLQCVVCEDWFHEGCLIPPDGGDTKRIADVTCELVCANCADENTIRTQLLDAYYEKYGLFRPGGGGDSGGGVGASAQHHTQPSTSGTIAKEEPVIAVARETATRLRLNCTRPPPALVAVTSAHAPLQGKDRLWPAGFRQNLCICDECKRTYRRAGVGYLVDCQDSPDLAGYLTDRERTRVRAYIVKMVEEAVERGLNLDKAALLKEMEKLRDEIVERG